MTDVRVLSVFDGMSCGYLAMLGAGLKVSRYVAYEIDKYAVQTSAHNFPDIEHKGDVFEADFTEYRGFDFLVGGSPCTYWSIAQKNGRETEASGMGWELFSQYVRALKEAQPMFFIYENNKSMSNAIRESITETFGFEPVCINSSLVSAQNRQRLYWVGKRNPDGTYSRVHVEQPEDRGILLRDILDSGEIFYETTEGKSFALVSSYYKAAENPFGTFGNERRRQRVAEPVSFPFGETNGKAFAPTSSYWKGQPHGKILDKSQRSHVAEAVRIPEYGMPDKSRPVTASYAYKGCGEGSLLSEAFPDNPSKQVRDYISEAVGIGYRGRMEDGKWVKRFESNEEPKANALTTCPTDSMGAIRVGALPRPNGELSTSQAFRVYSTDGKSVNITSGGGGAGGKTGLYAIPVEFNGEVPTKAMSMADGKTYTVYQVKDGQITIKGKQYPIKLADGFYIIRKLTVAECKRLQTVPERYEFPVSDTQAYRQLGNGWTIEVIVHLIKATQSGALAEEQLSLF